MSFRSSKPSSSFHFLIVFVVILALRNEAKAHSTWEYCKIYFALNGIDLPTRSSFFAISLLHSLHLVVPRLE